MNIVLPKESRGYVYYRIFTVEMNNFDVERLLPSLFYLIVTKGRQRAKIPNDPTAFDTYIERLSTHAGVSGFNTASGRRLLDRWIRSSVIQVGKKGRAQKDEQIECIQPLTFLAYKSGLPSEITRQRKVHLFLYWLMCSVLTQPPLKLNEIQAKDALDKVFREAFGSGIVIGVGPKFDGKYNGFTNLDLQTLLCLYYLDGFAPTEISNTKESSYPFGPALPWLAENFGKDILQYVMQYATQVPTLALTRSLLALINFELFIYTLKLVYAINELVQTGELPTAMTRLQKISPPEVYADFTRDRGDISDFISVACVEQHLEEVGVFFKSSMQLRTTDRFVQENSYLRRQLLDSNQKEIETPEYLKTLVRLFNEPDIRADARAEIRKIRTESTNACANEVEQEEIERYFSFLDDQFEGNAMPIVVELLSVAQMKSGLESYTKWLSNIGGLRKSYGLLAGNLKGRRNWRYAMSDDLLAALVNLAFIETPDGNLDAARLRQRLPLREFLQFLELRFGILVDRPPTFLDTAQNRQAALANLEALKRRLRMMGFFEALSDDFNAQYLRAPLAQEGTR